MVTLNTMALPGGLVNIEEPCPINPSMQKRFCSHCNPPSAPPPRGVHGTDTTHSIREDSYEGYPTIELLANGGPIHFSGKGRLTFGIRKAKMLLACLEPIKEFAFASDDNERRRFKDRSIQEGPNSIIVSIHYEPDFELSSGVRVNKPYLKCELPGTDTVKGLGAMKCRALWELREEIGEWLARVS